jgi:hypothetical protein
MVNFISKKFLGALAALVLFMTPAMAETEVEVGVDAVSRYVWRGTPVGNSVALQPSVGFALDSGVGALAEAGTTNVGVWGSYGLTSGAADEINISLSQGVGFATLSVTDYYFPLAANGEGNSFFEFGDDAGHSIEVGASVDYGDVSLFLGRFINGTSKEDTYVELGYGLTDNLTLALGVGDGSLAAAEDFALVNASLSVTSDNDYGATFTINPDTETAFFVVSKSW